jgi:2',3'-cyclic-nucleotide 2'-phosphodiesterase (5'-nucleotidase family)
MLSANAVLSVTGELLAEPYTILEVSGYRLGIIGLTRVPAQTLDGVRVMDPGAAAAEYVPRAAEQADTVVVLTNMGFRGAMALAQASPGIDLLIAALPGQLPTQAVPVPETGTLAVTAEQPMARHTGRRVGRLVVEVASDGSLANESWVSVPMDKTLADDLQMQVLLDGYRQ